MVVANPYLHGFSKSIYRFSRSIYGFPTSIYGVFEVQKLVYDLENDSQRSKISFDHLNLDVWRSRKPISMSKVAKI